MLTKAQEKAIEKDLKEIREQEIEKCTDEILNIVGLGINQEIYIEKLRKKIKEILNKYIE